MNNLIIDAANDKIFFTIITNESVYTSSHKNSKINYERLMLLIDKFLKNNKKTLDDVDVVYVNRGPGSFARIRNSLSMIKALYITKK